VDDRSLIRLRRHPSAAATRSASGNAAVLHELQVTRGRELLAEDEAQFGPVSADVRAQVTAEWPA
jgi:hypothetical protein